MNGSNINKCKRWLIDWLIWTDVEWYKKETESSLSTANIWKVGLWMKFTDSLPNHQSKCFWPSNLELLVCCNFVSFKLNFTLMHLIIFVVVIVSILLSLLLSRRLNIKYFNWSDPQSFNANFFQCLYIIGPIPWGHSGPLCHALSLSSSSLSWTSMRRRRATVPLATSGEWAWGGSQ